MPSVLNHRRPAGSAEPAGIIPDLRKQAVGGNDLGGSLDLVVTCILHPDRHRQVFAGDQVIACLSIFKAILLAEPLPLAEIIQHQRCRAEVFIRFYGIPRIGIGFNFKFLNGVAGLILYGGIKLRLIPEVDLAGGHHQQLILIDDIHRKIQTFGRRRAHRVAAVIADPRAILQTFVAVAQFVEVVEVFRRIVHRLPAEKHRVNAAAGRIELHYPVAVPQVRLGFRLRIDPGSGGILDPLAVRGHIGQRGRLVVIILIRVRGDHVQLGNAYSAGRLIIAVLTGSPKPGHPVLHGGEDHLRPAVQLRLPEIFLNFGDRDHGQGKQNHQDQYRHQHLHQRKAAHIVPCCLVFHGGPFLLRPSVRRPPQNT